jgi:alpha-D-xyloside xylohydrolase
VRLPRPGFSGVSGAPNEIWSFGPEACTMIEAIIRMRLRLVPYIMEQMAAAAAHGTPVMRPLFFDLPADPRCYEIEDEYMFGPDVLVAPVLQQGQTSRRVYLPAGAQWTDAWTGEVVRGAAAAGAQAGAAPGGAGAGGGDGTQGGGWITADAPLDRVPVYLRDGADVPVRE